MVRWGQHEGEHEEELEEVALAWEDVAGRVEADVCNTSTHFLMKVSPYIPLLQRPHPSSHPSLTHFEQALLRKMSGDHGWRSKS